MSAFAENSKVAIYSSLSIVMLVFMYGERPYVSVVFIIITEK